MWPLTVCNISHGHNQLLFLVYISLTDMKADGRKQQFHDRFILFAHINGVYIE